MEPLLFLCHRIPYPPNKGDKVRSYHLLKHFASRYRVYLGTFVDDPADWPHLGKLNELCADVMALPLNPLGSRIKSVAGFVTGEALTLPYFRARALQRWINQTLKRERIRKCFVFSSAMAQYVTGRAELRRVVDLVDVDSEKWRQYSSESRWPLSWIYRREADRLLAFEESSTREFDASLLTTAAEKALFLKHAPQLSERVHVVPNGVDTDFFSPAPGFERPFPSDEQAIVFTGAMDYWPNADAACWFASEVLPVVLRRHERARFYVVGMNPLPSVRALARQPAVTVTGRVSDTRPYLQHASVVVAPLRIARGVQNKILEAMAMARPVVASAACANSLSSISGRELLVAGGASEFSSRVCEALDTEPASLGNAGRARVLRDYQWGHNLSLVDALLEDTPVLPQQPASVAPSVARLHSVRS
ncbi:MAG: TIGR03087 family PEP-CTERM/XrtA system glycosyltransferase [Burkholderiales bacterium]